MVQRQRIGDLASMAEHNPVLLVAAQQCIQAAGRKNDQIGWKPGADPSDHVIFIIDDDVCTRCALCVDRCPTGVIILGKAGSAPRGGDTHARTNNHGYAYGMRL